MTALDALNLSAPLADTYSAVEQRLLVAVARQLTLNDNHALNEVSKWQIKQLANMGMLRKDAARIIAAGTKGVPADFADTVQQAIAATLAEDGLVDMWENEGFSESAKQAIKHYRRQAQDVYNQVNTVMKYKAESTFVRAVNSVADKWTAEMRRNQPEIADKQDVLDILNSNTASVVSGSTARTKAVRNTIHEMAQRGIPAFVDKAGREWSPEAYVNMDIRATVKNTALDTQFGVMDSLGQDVFEVSSHPGSRPKCRPWQGKLISRSGKTTEITDIKGRKHKVIPLSQTSFGEPDGLFGINCGHRPRGVSDGLFRKSEVDYDDEEDKELYGKVCRQRELERKVRKSKTEADMLEAAGDTEGARAVRQKMSEQNKALRAYCESNGLKMRSDRVRTYGSVKPTNTVETSDDISYMSKSFRPVFEQSKPISYDTKTGVHEIKVKKVANSKFSMLTDEANTRRNKAVRYYEKHLAEIQQSLPQNVEIPTIAVVDFEANGLKSSAIGGYDKRTGILYLNSKYDTPEKIRDYVSKTKGQFANATEDAPILHEMGHKYYEDTIKRLAKSRKICYNEAQNIVDSIILEQTKNIPDGLTEAISEYANAGYKRHKYTEIIAECYSAYDTNSYAKSMIDALNEVI